MSFIRSTVLLTAGIVSIGLAAPTSHAQAEHADQSNHAEHAQSEHDASKPVNSMCPVGNEPIEDDGGSTVYKGKPIGFCCPGCIEKFEAWDEAKKDEFVAMSMMSPDPEHTQMYACPMHPSETSTDKNATCSKCSMSLVAVEGGGQQAMHGDMGADMGTTSARIGDPYPLSTCPISGEEFGGMGDPITKVYDGREVKFCCKMCVPKFEKDLKASFAKLDQQIIESQLPFYPLTTCVVSGEQMGGEQMGEPINYVYNNRLIRFCCKMCKGDFKKDPQAYIAKLDAAVIAQQSEHYPLSTCPISGEELEGEMGETINKVYAGRLVKFCCTKCVEKFEANPSPTIEKLDAAWMAMHKGGKMEGKHEMSEGGMKDHDADESHESHGMSGHHDG